MAKQSFKDLLVWQKAKILTVDINTAFLNCKNLSFKDQILRATLSIMNNIAEGHGRRSDRALKSFLIIAKGSTAEVESMLLVAPDLMLISPSIQAQLLPQTQEIGKLLIAFISKL